MQKKYNLLIFTFINLFSSFAYCEDFPEPASKDELIDCTTTYALIYKLYSNSNNKQLVNDAQLGYKFFTNKLNSLNIYNKDQVRELYGQKLLEFEEKMKTNPDVITPALEESLENCVAIIKAYKDEQDKLFDPSLPRSFLISKLMLRPYVDDMHGVTVRKYITDLTEYSLADGSNPKIMGWNIAGNKYTLSLNISNVLATLTFIHDLSEPGSGKTTLLLPIQFDGEEIDAISFSMIMNSK